MSKRLNIGAFSADTLKSVSAFQDEKRKEFSELCAEKKRLMKEFSDDNFSRFSTIMVEMEELGLMLSHNAAKVALIIDNWAFLPAQKPLEIPDVMLLDHETVEKMCVYLLRRL